MTRLVIFDLDGTLLDTLTDIANSLNEILRTYGYPEHPTATYRAMVGNGVETLMRRAVPAHACADEFSKMSLSFRQLYIRRSQETTKPYDGVPELLSGLKERGILSAVFSNKPHDATLPVISHYFPQHEFSEVLGLRPGHPPKPDPEGALEILSRLGVLPEHTLYLGDSDVDMRTAKNAGLTSVGALWGFRTEEELLKNGASHVISSPLELLSLIDGNNA